MNNLINQLCSNLVEYTNGSSNRLALFTAAFLERDVLRWRHAVDASHSRRVGAIFTAHLAVHVGHDLRGQPEPVDHLVLPLVDENAILKH